MSNRRNALGTGLGALLGSRPVPVTAPTQAPEVQGPQSIRYISIDKIEPNPQQPRHTFAQESLEELADSIRQHGVLQPVLVTAKSGGGFYLVAGERRFRACKLAGMATIPAILQDLTEAEMLEIAIVENVQRDDLNPVDEARSYRKLIEAFGWTQDETAQRVGKKRTTITNSLRLLKLGEEALGDLEEGRITAGHARAILSIDETFYRQRLRQEIVRKGLSVREAERRAAQYQNAGSPTQRPDKKGGERVAEDLDIVSLQDRMMEHLGCRVRIRSRDGRSGSVEIPFQSVEELDRFLQAIGLPDSD